jgi:abortive infection bacteriophage resistance protein
MVAYPITYEKQIDKLKELGFLIENSQEAEEFLSQVSFYRLSGYFQTFETVRNAFTSNLSFKTIVGIYEFDEQLRNALALVIGQIEIQVRTAISEFHSTKYDAFGYLDEHYFLPKFNHTEFIEQVEKQLKKHRKNWDKPVPIWEAIEVFTMGMLSSFYARMPTADRHKVAERVFVREHQLNSWLQALTSIRNMCAHYDRIYGVRFHQIPRLPSFYNAYADPEEQTLFKQIFMLKLIHCNQHSKWNRGFLAILIALIMKYYEYINLNQLGFPDDWQEALTW